MRSPGQRRTVRSRLGRRALATAAVVELGPGRGGLQQFRQHRVIRRGGEGRHGRHGRVSVEPAELRLPVHEQHLRQQLQHLRPAVADVPAAVLVRHRREAHAEHVAEPGLPGDVQRHHGHGQAEALHVVQRHPGDRPGRGVLAEHAARRAAGLGTGHRVPAGRARHHGGQPDRADDGDEQGVLADLVPVQRAEPDHADTRRVGPDRVRARATATRRSATAPPSTTT